MFPAPAASAGANSHAKRGFTLIELMIVVSIITISATVTFASINRDKYSVAVESFAEEIGAEVMRARDTAIDQQTTTEVDFFARGLAMRMTDQATATQVPLRFMRRSEFGGGRLGNEVCIHGVYPLIYAPSENVPTNIPLSPCPTGGLDAISATFRFGPDGTFEVANGTVQGSTRNGWTVVVRDGRGPRPEFFLIEVFPTGMVRVLPHIKDGSE